MKRVEPEPEIESIKEFRWTLIRRIADLTGNWHLCEQRACRRKRRCAAANGPCVGQPLIPRPEPSPEQAAAMMANLYRRLQALAAQAEEERTETKC